MKMHFAEILRCLRRDRGLTQEQLAQQFSVSDQSVSRWETGATYPDIELLPVIAAYFDVTLDELMGVTQTRREHELEAWYNRFDSTNDAAERLKILREVCRDFPREWPMVYNLCRATDDLDEKRRTAEELLKNSSDPTLRKLTIETIIAAETDENLPALLNQYATPGDMRKIKLLEGRYREKEDWANFERTKQLILRDALINEAFPRMINGYPPKVDVHNSLHARRTQLEIINLLTSQTGLSMVAGDGEPDLWYHHRMQAGIRVSCHLAATGEREAALTALEEMTALFERFYALPDGTVLTYRCPALDQLSATVKHDMRQGPTVGEDWNIRRSMRHIGCQDWFEFAYPHMDLHPLIAERGWAWFDPIRDDPRYLTCIERMRAFVVEEPM